jgi:hypothetical protein
VASWYKTAKPRGSGDKVNGAVVRPNEVTKCPWGAVMDHALQAHVWNMGTCRLNAKGDAQVETPQEPEYQCEAQGRTGP